MVINSSILAGSSFNSACCQTNCFSYIASPLPIITQYFHNHCLQLPPPSPSSISCHHSTPSALQPPHLPSPITMQGSKKCLTFSSFPLSQFLKIHSYTLILLHPPLQFLCHPTSQLPLCLLEPTSAQLVFHLNPFHMSVKTGLSPGKCVHTGHLTWVQPELAKWVQPC